MERGERFGDLADGDFADAAPADVSCADSSPRLSKNSRSHSSASSPLSFSICASRFFFTTCGLPAALAADASGLDIGRGTPAPAG